MSASDFIKAAAEDARQQLHAFVGTHGAIKQALKLRYADILRGPRRHRDSTESKPRLADRTFLAGIGAI